MSVYNWRICEFADGGKVQQKHYRDEVVSILRQVAAERSNND